MGPGLLFGVMKSSKIDCGYVLHNCVKRLKTISFELMVHFEWIVWYVNYVSIKLFFRNLIRRRNKYDQPRTGKHGQRLPSPSWGRLPLGPAGRPAEEYRGIHNTIISSLQLKFSGDFPGG